MKHSLTIALLAMGAAAVAQNAPVPATTNVVPISQGKPISAAVADMAKAANVLAAVDPQVTGNVSATTGKLSIEAGLAAIATANRVEWRKVYLAEGQIPRASDGTVDAVKLKAMVEAATAVPEVTIGVLDPAKNTVAMTTRAPAAAPGTATWLKDKTTVYLLYRPTAGKATDPITSYLDGQKAALDMYKSMTPEQRAEVSRRGMEMVMKMDPATMSSMMQDSMKAMQNLSAEEKAKLFDMGTQMMHNTPPPQ
jgi:hypothetical protein